MYADVDMEKEALSIFLQHNEKESVDPTMLRAEYFTSPATKAIYLTAIDLWQRQQPVNMINVTSRMKEQGTVTAGGQVLQIMQMGSAYVDPYNFKHAAKVLEKLYHKRAVIGISQEVVETLQNESESDPLSVFATAEEKFFKVTTASNGTPNKQDDIDRYVNEATNPDINPTKPFNLELVDSLISGARGGDMIIVAGRPGMGKSALCLSMMLESAKTGVRSMFFQIDMGRQQFYDRVFAYYTGIPVNKISYALALSEQERAEIRAAAEIIKHEPYHLDFRSRVTTGDIRSAIRQKQSREGIDVVYVDHIGKITPAKTHSREREIGIIAEELKAISKDYGITVVAMSQLNRGVEYKPDKRPMLSDLRDSGAIEQEADIVLFPFRPEYYHEQLCRDEMTPADGAIEIDVAKNRNGAAGFRIGSFNGPLTKVSSRITQLNFGA